MAVFYNQATLNFGGRVTNSNVTEGEVITRVSLTKTAVSTDYGPGDNIVYAVTLTNADTEDKTGITLTDNLGEFATEGGGVVVPLNYVDGSILYYRNGVLQPAPTVNAGPPLVINGIDIPAGGNVIILYETRANTNAPLSAGAVVSNRVTATGDSICDDLAGESSVTTREEANLSIAKAICPATITCGDEVTYTFIIQNSGNTSVVATDDLIVSDIFNPPLSGIAVTLNGTALVVDVGYTYDETTGAFNTIAGAVTVPAATYVTDPLTGVVTTSPGVAELVITGTIK